MVTYSLHVIIPETFTSSKVLNRNTPDAPKTTDNRPDKKQKVKGENIYTKMPTATVLMTQQMITSASTK